MTIEIAPLTMKPPRLNGLSQHLLESHYENNYGGAVRRLNAIDARLAGLDWSATPGFEINGLKREQLVAAGSVLLHEIYFDSLGGAGGDPEDPALAAALTRDFGSIAAWRQEFVSMGKALAGGSGWVLLTWCDRLERLTNQWSADHATALASAVPILALDMYEHAYHRDFGADAGGYVDAFMANIDWTHVAARFSGARGHGIAGPAEAPQPAMSVAALHDALGRDSASAPIVIDVRLPEDHGRDALPDAPWRPMDEVDNWSKDLPTDRPIVVYCMYGFWVSQDTAACLRERGFDARILAGGISAWRGMGYVTTPLESNHD